MARRALETGPYMEPVLDVARRALDRTRLLAKLLIG